VVRTTRLWLADVPAWVGPAAPVLAPAGAPVAEFATGAEAAAALLPVTPEPLPPFATDAVLPVTPGVPPTVEATSRTTPLRLLLFTLPAEPALLGTETVAATAGALPEAIDVPCS
jgi:hypothetical protein